MQQLLQGPGGPLAGDLTEIEGACPAPSTQHCGLLFVINAAGLPACPQHLQHVRPHCTFLLHKLNAHSTQNTHPPTHASPGLDYLSSPSGVIADAQALAAAAFGAAHTFFLVNGCTAGVHAAVMATCGPGTTLLAARNCHLSVFNAAVLAGCSVAWVEPEADAAHGVAHGVTPAALAAALAAQAAAGVAVGAVMVVSPTYFGAVARVEGARAAAAGGVFLSEQQLLQAAAAAAEHELHCTALHRLLNSSSLHSFDSFIPSVNTQSWQRSAMLQACLCSWVRAFHNFFSVTPIHLHPQTQSWRRSAMLPVCRCSSTKPTARTSRRPRRSCPPPSRPARCRPAPTRLCTAHTR